MARRSHLISSGQVLVLSCVAVFAVTTMRVSAMVESAQRITQPTSVDLPMPWPLARAIRMGTSLPRWWPSRNLRPSSSSSSRCQSQGPLASASAVLASPHGKAKMTKPKGSVRNVATRSMSFCSISAAGCVMAFRRCFEPLGQPERHLEVAAELELLAILLRHELGHQPFARVDTQPRALDGLVVHGGAPVLPLDPVILPVVGNLEDFLGEIVGLGFTGAGVDLLKFAVCGQPPEGRPHVRHVGRAAYLAHGLSDRDLRADPLDDFRAVF